MAIVRAVKTGNWSDTTVWNTGALPTSADNVYSNTFTVTIDTSPTVLSINNGTATGVTAGGSFTLSAGTTVTTTGNGFQQNVSNGTLLNLTLGTGQQITLAGALRNIFSVSGSNTSACLFATGSGTLNVQGNIQQEGHGGNANVCCVFLSSNSMTINITGNIVNSASNAGSGRNDCIFSASFTGILNVTGNVTAPLVTGFSNGNRAISITSATSTVNVTGNVTGGASSPAIDAAGTLNVTGVISANAVTGVNVPAGATLTHVGTATAANGAPAITSLAYSSLVILSGPFLCSANGTLAVLCPNWKWANSPTATYYQIRTANLATIRPLYTADSVGGNPAVSNVRSGTVFGPNSELTGTCAVPGAASVVVGTPVDATVGTAAITAATIRTAMGLASANLDTQLSAIPTAAAIRTEMDANSTKLANLDAPVSSRSTYNGADTSGTTTLLSRLTTGRAGNLDNLDATVSSRPTAADIATAVWAAATRTLTTAIDNSSTIAAAVWGYATGRTITGGTVDTLTNAPSVPSAATIASQVRTELSTELARIDVATSSRLAPAGTLARVTLTDTATTLTNAPTVPTAAQIATATRSELTPELARVSNCATVESTGDQIAALNS